MRPRIMPLCLLCLPFLLAFPQAAWAQHVYKCVDGVDTSYQSAPCAKGKRLAKEWAAIPDPPLTPEQVTRQRAAEVRGEQESRYLRALANPAGKGRRSPRPTAVTISAARDGDRCAKAKRRRDATERSLGLDRTFETMQRLSKLVSEACR